MPGLLCEIVGRQKDVEAMPGMLSHFELADGLVVECEFLATDMTWSLFCYDAKSRQAVFVELPGDIDLSETPFAYVTQFNMAKRVLLVSFDELEELARLAPCPDKIVMVYSIGRCGSTLVSNILSYVPNVWSISEPDPLTNLATGNWEAEKEQCPKNLTWRIFPHLWARRSDWPIDQPGPSTIQRWSLNIAASCCFS